MIAKCRYAVALMLALAASAAQAQTSWVDSPNEGGWKDTTTGLVWVDHTLIWDSCWYWQYAQDLAANLVYSVDPTYYPTFSDWRCPTKAELQAAAQNQIMDYVPMSVTPGSPYWYWSSDYVKQRGGQAWAVRIATGEAQLWAATRTHGACFYFMVVRQGTK
jgi:hypothetical protein